MKMHTLLPFFLAFSLMTCHPPEGDPSKNGTSSSAPVDEEFKDYWYSGKAELSRYELKQRRYGEIREGDAIMVFVTEPFLIESQVKKEQESEEASTNVLKLNYTKDFVTGIYDYHLMTSVFDPVDRDRFGHPLKVTMSSQEWCGQSFIQLNRRNNEAYRVESRSYFQSEGDVDTSIAPTLLEDEIWTRIRTAPGQLPEGERELYPSTMSVRLLHQGVKLRTAELSHFKPREQDSIYPGENLKGYKIHYENPERILRIFYEADFPHRIAGWEEHLVSHHGETKKELRTRAVRTHQIRSPYWEKNAKKHRELREELGLE